jgi:hypothetical protein
MYKKIIFIFMISLLLSQRSYAIPIQFSGIANNGTGSALMDFDITGNMLTAELTNTSPIDLNSGLGENAPGIVFFGFDLSNETLPALNSWELTAFLVSGTPVVIGNSSGVGDWTMDIGIKKEGVTLDYSPTNTGNSKGAFYNMDALTSSVLAAGPNYFTTAFLTMTFDASPSLDENSTFVRMKNVGFEGEGSLKLVPTPEPSTFLLLGNGLLGLLLYSRKMRKK